MYLPGSIAGSFTNHLHKFVDRHIHIQKTSKFLKDYSTITPSNTLNSCKKCTDCIKIAENGLPQILCKRAVFRMGFAIFCLFQLIGI